MSGTSAVAPAHQSFVVEWEEPEPGGFEVAEEPSSASLLVTVAAAAVRHARSRDRADDLLLLEAERLAQAWMQGEPSS